MENTPHLYDTLVHVLSQHAEWSDQRHLTTLAWMMLGLIHSGWISLTAWAPYVVSRARYAQSTVRRLRRWLDKLRVWLQLVAATGIGMVLGGVQLLPTLDALQTSVRQTAGTDFAQFGSLHPWLPSDAPPGLKTLTRSSARRHESGRYRPQACPRTRSWRRTGEAICTTTPT